MNEGSDIVDEVAEDVLEGSAILVQHGTQDEGRHLVQHARDLQSVEIFPLWQAL